MNELFRHFANKTSAVMGSAWAFIAALGLIGVWAVSGPFFHFSETWQLVINTSTTIITFLMVFLIQNSQNRDTQAIHLKLDQTAARGRRGPQQSGRSGKSARGGVAAPASRVSAVA